MVVLVGENLEALENVIEDEPHFIPEVINNNLRARGGSMAGRGGGWLAKHSMVLNEGHGGGELLVWGGKYSSESKNGEILKDLMGERCEDIMGLHGEAVWMEPSFNIEGNRLSAECMQQNYFKKNKEF
uniref:Uncharacterized protein n=1 Tax=Tanacetum cinerariifolium TaxID=118510 RepID=A0A6L2M1Y2_TANCI|nr:hypothetical protein [Tanacetum cinerariifolium]